MKMLRRDSRVLGPLILLGFAAVFFITKENVAGFALLGAGVTRTLDLIDVFYKEKRDERARIQRDLSETRRLIYIALARMRAEVGEQRAEAAATLAHALAYHSKLRTPEQAETLMENIVFSDTWQGDTAKELRTLAETITARLAGSDALGQ